MLKTFSSVFHQINFGFSLSFDRIEHTILLYFFSGNCFPELLFCPLEYMKGNSRNISSLITEQNFVNSTLMNIVEGISQQIPHILFLVLELRLQNCFRTSPSPDQNTCSLQLIFFHRQSTAVHATPNFWQATSTFSSLALVSPLIYNELKLSCFSAYHFCNQQLQRVVAVLDFSTSTGCYFSSLFFQEII